MLQIKTIWLWCFFSMKQFNAYEVVSKLKIKVPELFFFPFKFYDEKLRNVLQTFVFSYDPVIQFHDTKFFRQKMFELIKMLLSGINQSYPIKSWFLFCLSVFSVDVIGCMHAQLHEHRS